MAEECLRKRKWEKARTWELPMGPNCFENTDQLSFSTWPSFSQQTLVEFLAISFLGKILAYGPLIHSFNQCIENLLYARPCHPASHCTGRRFAVISVRDRSPRGVGRMRTPASQGPHTMEDQRLRVVRGRGEGVWIRGNRRVCSHWGWQREEVQDRHC